ncbi:LPS assembly protein LptD [Sphingomonas sp. BIUV-7]|uniref:LPS-assembly protein LptD n=1 Tax=Sphingomonas natans TaxID=3063330 RepID=A0ABT8YFR5_9SPHN|nr:LPS assembly protein LptD [Sphingomonas sp. BIUV-7]MDO6416922.1 LPS assembly protein LptD [Sphingomonas sp. BIUV-7]
MKRGAIRFRGCALAPFVILAIGAATSAQAQNLQDRPVAPPADAAGLPATNADDQVSFASDALDYDDTNDIVTASGDVRMQRAGSRLRADKVVWNRRTGEVHASGNVAVVNPGGDTAYSDESVLTDDMKDGVVENLLIVLANGGRLAARHGVRKGEITTLDRAAYTPCSVENVKGCAQEPSWKVTAVRIIHDGNRHRIYYKDARISILGQTVLWLPGFSHPDGSNQAGGGSGLLLPNFEVSSALGVDLSIPYYLQLAPNRDLTVTPHVYSKVAPGIEAQYRALNTLGAYQVRGMVTYGSRLPASVNATALDKDKGIRAFIDANGTYQLGPDWTLSGQVRLQTDRTFMRRYDISSDDRLRSSLSAERIDTSSYLQIAGWYVQSVRTGDKQGQQPIALPAIDYRKRITDPWLGGVIQLQANSLSLIRTDGQDTQRAFAGARWDLRTLTGLGQQVTFTAYSRADIYHSDENDRSPTVVYRGREGWEGRAIVAGAVDMRWPFIGSLFGGSQQLTPRVQLVASPQTRNLVIPNEDARAIDLEDSNLFALNRFAGYDRWEDGSRVTYGAEWNYQRPRVEIRAVAGQSYRLTSEPTILPPGTGLSDRFSDIVGRVSVKYGKWLEVTERFRIDKDNLNVRRNEVDATIGSSHTYALIGYLRLNRNIDTSIEDLRDREEIRLGGRVQIARFWSIFGSTVVDLTGKSEDPLALTDGYQPVRQRVGVVYEDECLSLGVSWRKDYDPTGDARRGSTFSLRLALKNIGR